MASKKLKKIIDDDKKYLFQNYGDRLPVCFERGEGACLYDQDNRKYIDFFSGIAVCNLGYKNSVISSAIQLQSGKVLHTSNWFLNKEQIKAAELISRLSFSGKTLFLNSGTEANEAAIKLARKYGKAQNVNKYKIISFEGSFHGRTFGSMSATAQEKIRKGFEPLVPGFIYLPFNDIDRIRKEITKNSNICAVIIELIQGEGGINPAEKDFIKELFKLCGKNNILTIVDEIQTGIGRTGKPFAYQNYNIKPDMITLAKGLGGGLPIGALHVKNELAKHLSPGSHGTTFGGNHLACAAAASVLNEFTKPGIFKNILQLSNYINSELKEIKNKVNFIKEIRGIGLHIGIELTKPGMDLVKKALSMGLIINCTADKVIRIMPPLNMPMKTAKEGMKILRNLLLEEGK